MYLTLRKKKLVKTPMCKYKKMMFIYIPPSNHLSQGCTAGEITIFLLFHDYPLAQ